MELKGSKINLFHSVVLTPPKEGGKPNNWVSLELKTTTEVAT